MSDTQILRDANGNQVKARIHFVANNENFIRVRLYEVRDDNKVKFINVQGLFPQENTQLPNGSYVKKVGGEVYVYGPLKDLALFLENNGYAVVKT